MLLQNIKALCKAQGISLAELEIKAGLPPKSIYRWDSVLPSYDKVVKVAKALGTTVEALTL